MNVEKMLDGFRTEGGRKFFIKNLILQGEPLPEKAMNLVGKIFEEEKAALFESMRSVIENPPKIDRKLELSLSTFTARDIANTRKIARLAGKEKEFEEELKDIQEKFYSILRRVKDPGFGEFLEDTGKEKEALEFYIKAGQWERAAFLAERMGKHAQARKFFMKKLRELERSKDYIQAFLLALSFGDRKKARELAGRALDRCEELGMIHEAIDICRKIGMKEREEFYRNVWRILEKE